MKASLVIPTHNCWNLVDNCLLSLRHVRVPAGDELEVVVVDDGSTDATADTVRAHLGLVPGLRYLFLPRSESSSRSSARNAGARAATGELLIFLDGDQIVSPDFVERHLDAHRADDSAAVIGFRKYLKPGPSDVDAYCRSGDESYLAPITSDDMRLDLLDRLAYLPGQPATAWHLFFSCNISVRRTVFWAVGGGSEEFTGWGLEDSELGYRLSRHGCRFVLDRDGRVYHQGSEREPETDIYQGWLRNLETFMRLHDHAPDVVLQKVLAPFFDPARRGDWIDCYERFELAVRATQGLPTAPA
ncbi:MAG TPA: glycosyltransferase [Actinoplanes sp.]|nr:glycosyltransferase [Actinoplanes sp.]